MWLSRESGIRRTDDSLLVDVSVIGDELIARVAAVDRIPLIVACSGSCRRQGVSGRHISPVPADVEGFGVDQG